MTILGRLMNERAPVRYFLRSALRELGIGDFRFRLRMGALHRPHYGYIMYQAASLAARLGLNRISVVEFGVAGGAGLLWMERHADNIEKLIPEVKIEIYGFDTGEGLPPPQDFRDLPYHWKKGFFAMNRDQLQAKLRRAKLVFGDVNNTTKNFFKDFSPAPIGAVSHDMDFYSSTKPALELFAGDNDFLMPRIFTYFDDTLGGAVELYSEFTGELLAISEFNQQHDQAKIAPANYLRVRDGGEAWRHQIWIAHRFDHPKYNTFVSMENQQLQI